MVIVTAHFCRNATESERVDVEYLIISRRHDTAKPQKQETTVCQFFTKWIKNFNNRYKQ